MKTNPIVALERRALTQIPVFRLRQPPPKQPQRLVWAVRWLAMLLAFGGYLLTMLSSVFGVDITGVVSLQLLHDIMAVVFILSLYEWLFLTFHALSVGTQAIVRESQGKENWDLLCLTGLSARQFVWGKATTILSHFGEAILYITVLRIFVSLAFQYNYYWLFQLSNQPIPFLWVPPTALLMIPLLSFLFTAAMTVFAVCIGMCMAALSRRRPGQALIFSAVGFLGFWLSFAFLYGRFNRPLLRLTYNAEGMQLWLPNILNAVIISLVDGGVTLLRSMLEYHNPNPYVEGMGGQVFDNLVIYMVVAVVTLVIYALLSVGLLWLTTWLLRRRGMS